VASGDSVRAVKNRLLAAKLFRKIRDSSLGARVVAFNALQKTGAWVHRCWSNPDQL